MTRKELEHQNTSMRKDIIELWNKIAAQDREAEAKTKILTPHGEVEVNTKSPLVVKAPLKYALANKIHGDNCNVVIDLD